MPTADVTYIHVSRCDTFYPIAYMLTYGGMDLDVVNNFEWESEQTRIQEAANESIEVRPQNDDEIIVFFHEHDETTMFAMGFFVAGFIEQGMIEGRLTRGESGYELQSLSPQASVAHLN